MYGEMLGTEATRKGKLGAFHYDKHLVWTESIDTGEQT
jgi:hypothetical protein